MSGDCFKNLLLCMCFKDILQNCAEVKTELFLGHSLFIILETMVYSSLGAHM